MSALPPILSLGDFDFDSFELPTEVPFGKEQAAYKHTLIGGGRVIDLLGAGDPDITWSGFFTGFQAQDRARYLENQCKQGKQLQLKTSDYVKDVVITRFTYGFHFIWPIQYTISLMVVDDKTQPVNTLVPGDLTTEIIDALIQAQDIAALINDPSINSALALALEAAQLGIPFTDNVAVNTALAAAFNAQAAIGAAIAGVQSNAF